MGYVVEGGREYIRYMVIGLAIVFIALLLAYVSDYKTGYKVVFTDTTMDSGVYVYENITIPRNASLYEIVFYENYFTKIDLYIDNASQVTVYSSTGVDRIDLDKAGRSFTLNYNGAEIVTLSVNKPSKIWYNYTIVSYKQPLLWLNLIALVLAVLGYIIGTLGIIQMIMRVLSRRRRY